METELFSSICTIYSSSYLPHPHPLPHPLTEVSPDNLRVCTGNDLRCHGSCPAHPYIYKEVWHTCHLTTPVYPDCADSSNTTTSSTLKMTSARATCPARHVRSSADCALFMIDPGSATVTVYGRPTGRTFFDNRTHECLCEHMYQNGVALLSQQWLSYVWSLLWGESVWKKIITHLVLLSVVSCLPRFHHDTSSL